VIYGINVKNLTV